MSLVNWIVVVVSVIAVAAAVAWFLGAQRFPERAATHEPGFHADDEVDD